MKKYMRLLGVLVAALMIAMAGLGAPAATAAPNENSVKPKTNNGNSGNNYADENYNSDLNKEWYWEQYFTDLGYQGVSCTKFDEVEQYTFTVPEGDWLAAIVKAGAKGDANNIVQPVKSGDVLTHNGGKKISHVILCSGYQEPPPPTTIEIPAQPYQEDPCNEPYETNNASWIVPDAAAEYYWDIVDGELIVYANEGYVFPDGSTSHNFGLPTESGVKCDVPPTVIYIPTKPTVDDPCNIPGEGDNASWIVPEDTAELTWKLVDGQLVVYANDGYVFTDGTDKINYGLPKDSGELCDTPPTTVDLPVPHQEDPCNEPYETNNASWIVPDAAAEYYWDIVAGELIVYANEGYVFPDGSNSHNFGMPTESGLACETETPPTVISISVTPGYVDPCNSPGEVHNSYWLVPANTAQISYELLAGGELLAHANEGYVFENGSTTFSFGLPGDDGVLCDIPPTTIDIPVKPDSLDPCNVEGETYNASWIVPANTDALTWELKQDGSLWVYANDGYVFADGTSSHNFGLAPEDGWYCFPGTA